MTLGELEMAAAREEDKDSYQGRGSVARLAVPGGDVTCRSHRSSSSRTHLVDLKSPDKRT